LKQKKIQQHFSSFLCFQTNLKTRWFELQPADIHKTS
jgi:hypothetical protein